MAIKISRLNCWDFYVSSMKMTTQNPEDRFLSGAKVLFILTENWFSGFVMENVGMHKNNFSWGFSSLPKSCQFPLFSSWTKFLFWKKLERVVRSTHVLILSMCLGESMCPGKNSYFLATSLVSESPLSQRMLCQKILIAKRKLKCHKSVPKKVK